MNCSRQMQQSACCIVSQQVRHALACLSILSCLECAFLHSIPIVNLMGWEAFPPSIAAADIRDERIVIITVRVP